MRRALLAALLVLTPVAAAAEPPAFAAPLGREHPLVGAIFDARTGAPVSVGELAARLAAADAALLGERHDNPDHHALQAWAVERMAERRPGGRLVLEMVAADADGPLAGARPDDVDGLGRALAWEERGWPDFALYAPILRAALHGGWTIAGGDPGPAEIGAVARGGLGALAPERRAALALDEPLAREAAAALEAELADAHCGLLPAAALPAMADAQRLRDAALAAALAQAPSPAALVAGAGHVRRDRAVPALLARLAPGRDVLSIAFVEVVDGADDPAAYVPGFGTPQALYDVVWLTPAPERDDPCEALRARFGPG